MAFKQIILLSCVLFAAYVECSISFGKCPDYETKDDFNATQYLGEWFEYAKYPYIFEAGGKCITATYGARSDGKVSVLNTQVNKLIGNTQSITGYAEVVSGGKLNVVLNVFPSVAPSAPYWVLDTDYTNYSVVWSCTEVGPLRQDVAWILTRERFPSDDVIAAAKAELVRQNISTDKLTINFESIISKYFHNKYFRLGPGWITDTGLLLLLLLELKAFSLESCSRVLFVCFHSKQNFN